MLCHVSADCISFCVLDYMHLVCLGAVRRMLQFCKKGDRIVRLSSAQILHISDKVVQRDFIQTEFARKPRSLTELEHWKAIEFRQFSLYTGPVDLKSVLHPQRYQHLLEYAAKLMMHSVSIVNSCMEVTSLCTTFVRCCIYVMMLNISRPVWMVLVHSHLKISRDQYDHCQILLCKL